MVFVKKRLYAYSIRHGLKSAYKNDLKRYSKYSDTYKSNSSPKLIGRIIRECHVIEKGLTMPDPRLGFGRELLISLSKNCIIYFKKYGNNEQLSHALGVILEYELFHKQHSFELDKELLIYINEIRKNYKVTPSEQRSMTKNNYFKNTDQNFIKFAQSRSSIRNYSPENISVEKIILALDLARNTPSACNRQCWRTYLFSNKEKMNEILKLQGGNRGFGHLANKIIVITSEIGAFTSAGERNAAFIDGGMYAMNLLYGLHFYKIAACILNCSFNVQKDSEMRMICSIKESEVFIAMILCGIPPDRFKIAASLRYPVDRTNTVL